MSTAEERTRILLIVQDNTVTRDKPAIFLTHEGYDVVAAPNGSVALQAKAGSEIKNWTGKPG